MSGGGLPCPNCERTFKTPQGLGDHRRDSHGLDAPVADRLNPTCIECGQLAGLVYGDVIYPHRPDLFSKAFWLCDCGAYCGCHGITTRALGNPCGPETRRARMHAHEAFDPLWRNRQMGRHEAYSWLSDKMGLAPEQTHIGMMTRDQALEVVRHCRERQRVPA